MNISNSIWISAEFCSAKCAQLKNILGDLSQIFRTRKAIGFLYFTYIYYTRSRVILNKLSLLAKFYIKNIQDNCRDSCFFEWILFKIVRTISVILVLANFARYRACELSWWLS